MTVTSSTELTSYAYRTPFVHLCTPWETSLLDTNKNHGAPVGQPSYIGSNNFGNIFSKVLKMTVTHYQTMSRAKKELGYRPRKYEFADVVHLYISECYPNYASRYSVCKFFVPYLTKSFGFKFLFFILQSKFFARHIRFRNQIATNRNIFLRFKRDCFAWKFRYSGSGWWVRTTR